MDQLELTTEARAQIVLALLRACSEWRAYGIEGP
jgi:hypothetical protein